MQNFLFFIEVNVQIEIFFFVEIFFLNLSKGQIYSSGVQIEILFSPCKFDDLLF